MTYIAPLFAATPWQWLLLQFGRALTITTIMTALSLALLYGGVTMAEREGNDWCE